MGDVGRLFTLPAIRNDADHPHCFHTSRRWHWCEKHRLASDRCDHYHQFCPECIAEWRKPDANR